MTDIADGQTVEVQGSGAKPYKVKRTGDSIQCSCPAWRNQSLAPDKRSCKHIRRLRGDAAEDARIGGTAPPRPVDATVAAAEAAKGRKLRPDEKAALNGPKLLLAMNAAEIEDLDPTGYWVSEKLDGVRAYWNGSEFVSRQGNSYHAPSWFTAGFPKTPLDGELWMGRKQFQTLVGIVKRSAGSNDEAWHSVSYVVFDAPTHGGTFEERQAALREMLVDYATDRKIGTWSNFFDELITRSLHWRVLEQTRCVGKAELASALSAMVAAGGEGLMLRQPGSKYEPCRSATLLKLKPVLDAEATVIGYTKGKGRHAGKVGALEVDWNGVMFNIGTGLSDADRAKPPFIGSRVTFAYTELTDGGVPRFPRYVATRDYE